MAIKYWTQTHFLTLEELQCIREIFNKIINIEMSLYNSTENTLVLWEYQGEIGTILFFLIISL